MDPNDPRSKEYFCKYCWTDEETTENPLIVTCKCSGSVGLTHFLCLKQWLSTQKQKKELGENVISYYWKKFECEICKQAYPYIFKVDKLLYKLIEIEKPKQPYYICMESLPLDKNTSRMIHMLAVSPEKERFKLGRGHESEVRVNDISVSRCHAIIKYRPEGFYVEDNISKFGTIVLVKGPLVLEEDKTKAVQIGRTVVSFTVRKVDPEKLKKARENKEVMGNYYGKAFTQEEGQVGPSLNIAAATSNAEKMQEQFLNGAEQQLRHYNTMTNNAKPPSSQRSRSAGHKDDVEMKE